MQRIETIDIAKGIGIILVVLGHLSSPINEVGWLSFMRGFVYQFHIPLFFFLSGIFIKTRESWSLFLKKKVARLYLPYAVSNLVFLAVYMFAHAANGDEIVLLDMVKHAGKVLLGMAVTPLGGATWFLFVLFVSQIIYRIISQLFSQVGDAFMFLAIVVMGISGMLLHPGSCLSKVFVAVLFLFLGQCISCDGFKEVLRKFSPYITVFFIVSIVAVLMCSQVNTVDMSQGKYGNPFLFLISSLAGIVLTIYLSELIAKVGNCKQFLSCLGSSSIWVLLFHFLAFRVISFLQVVVYGDALEVLFYHPCNRLSSLWPFVYALSGIMIPLVFKAKICKNNA